MGVMNLRNNMEFEVNIDVKDYKSFLKAFQNYVRTGNYNKTGLNKSRVMTLAFGMAVGIVPVIAFKLFGQKLHWPSMVSGGVLILFFVLYYSHEAQIKMMPKHNGVLVGKHIFNFSDSGVIDIGSLYETKASWQAFVSFQETEQHFFLLMDTCIGYIIPKSQLSSEQQEKEFRVLVQSKINA